MKVDIVGGGYTGISAAIYCKANKIDFEIYEKSENLGGILCEWVNGDGQEFARNCHYLTNNSYIVDYINRDKFAEFKLRYASYTDLWDEETVQWMSYGPVFNRKLESYRLKDEAATNLEQRLLKYPKIITDGLFKWLHNVGIENISDLHKNAAIPLGIERVFIRNNEAIKYKKTCEEANAMYGVPRETSEEIKFLLPKHGFNKIFEQIRKRFDEEGNKVIREVYKLKMNERKGNKMVLWTGNPLELLEETKGLKNKGFYAHNICFCTGHKIKEPIFIQVYSRKTKILRIYLYESKCTIEVSGRIDREVSDKWISDAIYIAKRCGYEISKVDEVLMKNDIRHNIISKDVWKELVELREKSKMKDIIFEQWNEYQREDKVERCISGIRRCILQER